MCGICGIIQTNASRYSRADLKKMTDALSHRGPDGEGLWSNETENVLLGHRRLSIIDLTDKGHQPMYYRQRFTIVHNGEVYNYLELKEELVKQGHTFFSQTDTEVIAAAYAHWGDDCVQHFDGMFAFAIWDEQEQKLFAARDRFGEKPFFYYYDDEIFLFASEMKALWAAGVDRRPELRMLFNFITIGYTDNPEQPGETFFQHIYKLPAASTLRFSLEKGVQLSGYWDIDPEYINKKITEEEALDRFSELLKLSVKRRLRSDVSLGTSLSGGIDSSSITALLQEMRPAANSHKVFTAVFDGFEKDESAYAAMMAEKFGLKQFTTSITAGDLVQDWETLCYHQEEPFGSASIYAQYKVYKLAAENGVKVLLDGQGADEIAAGYTKYYKWYWQELFRKRKLYRSGEIKAARQLGINEKFDYRNMIAAYFPSFATIVMEKQYLAKAIRQEDLTQEFVKEQSMEAYYTVPDHFTLNGILYFNTCVHGLEELLRYADRNSMAHGREVRLPFLSHELVEFVFSLPADFKIRKGWSKWIVREAMKNKLPDAITWRKDKVGFEPPQKEWMKDSRIQEMIQEAKRKMADEKILKPETLQKKIRPHGSHEAAGYDWRYLASAGCL